MGNIKKDNICFLDTEFNACDYPNQNEGFQEITSIGAVVFRNGKVIAKFSRYCLIKNYHYLSKRSRQITGITQGKLKKQGISFNSAMNELMSFLKQHQVQTIYAFGTSDSFEMRKTAKLNNSNKEVFQFINSIKNVYPQFQSALSLKYSFSLFDICRICNINHDELRAHDAVFDAEDTGKAFYNLKSKNINKKILEEINNHKNNVRLYRNEKSIKLPSVNPLPEISDTFIDDVKIVIKNAENKVPKPTLRALHDNIMNIIGRSDLELGEEDL